MTKKIYSPHDKMFKKAMTDVRIARNFFEHYLPNEIKELIDFDVLNLSPNSYIDEALNQFACDVLYETRIVNNPALLYILAEHFSTTKHFTPLKNLHYQVRIWYDYIDQNPDTKTLPLIVPIVFYNCETPYHGAKEMRELIHAPEHIIDKILFKPFNLIDTHHISDESLREQYWTGILVFLMKHIHARECLNFIEPFVEFIKKMELNEGGNASDYIRTLLHYLSRAGKTENPAHVLDLIVENISTPLGEEFMSTTLAEWWKNKGRNEGRAQGHAQGHAQGLSQGWQEGESKMLSRQIKHKFGVISSVHLEKIEKADCETLIVWGERILEAKNIDQIFCE